MAQRFYLFWMAVICVSITPIVHAAGAYYSDKPDLPDTPFTDATRTVKNVPIGGGWDWSLGGSLQTRFQSVDNRRDFRFDRNDEDFSIQNRVRINTEFHYSDVVKVYVEGQDAHEFFRDRLPGANPNEDSFDLSQAYVEVGIMKDIADMPSLIFKAGRQEFQLGREYLVGDKDWFNRGQVFDMGKVTWRPDGFDVLFFAGAPVIADDHNWNKTGHAHFAGTWLRAVGLPGNNLIEGGVIYRQNKDDTFINDKGQRGAESIWYFTSRAEGHFAVRWDYALEITANAGTRARERLDGWRGDANLGYTIPFGWRNLRVGGAYTLASGDSRPGDGRMDRFDSFYPDPFIFHGKLFVAAGVNLQDITAKLRSVAWRNGLIEIDYHHLSLQQSRDAMFDAASFTAARRDPTGNSGKDLGHAIDVQLTHKFHENLLLTGGAFMHQPGHYFTTTGSKGDDFARNYFVMVRVGF